MIRLNKLVKFVWYSTKKMYDLLRLNFLIKFNNGNIKFKSSKWLINFQGSVDLSIDSGELFFFGKATFRDLTSINVKRGELIFGDRVFFNRGCSINCRKKIIFGNDVLVGEYVKFYDHNHRFRRNIAISEQGFKCKDVIIGNNVWIGSGCVILPGTIIGDNSVIAANSVIKYEIPTNVIYENGKIKKIIRECHEI